MEASRYKDFDAAVAELEPIRFTVGGHEYTVAEPPAGLILRLFRNEYVDFEDPAAVVTLLESVLGKATYEILLDRGITLTQLQMVARWVLEQAGVELAADAGAGPGESLGKVSASTTSRSGGPNSKATSRGTTPSKPRSASRGGGSGR